MSAYIQTYTHAYNICISVFINVYAYIHTDSYMCVHAFLHTYVDTYTQTYRDPYIHMYVHQSHVCLRHTYRHSCLSTNKHAPVTTTTGYNVDHDLFLSVCAMSMMLYRSEVVMCKSCMWQIILGLLYRFLAYDTWKVWLDFNNYEYWLLLNNGMSMFEMLRGIYELSVTAIVIMNM